MFLRALLSRLRRPRPPAGPATTRPIVRRGLRFTSLQFSAEAGQSRMLTFRPYRLLVDYTRTMMGFVLIHADPRQIGMVGLGGGSLVKFCHRHLPQARVEVVEISPEVVALRRTFRVPPDGPRLRVVIGDGARFVAERPAAFDVLLVDGYDVTGIPDALAGQSFYDACRAALRPGGVLVVNLFSCDLEQHVARLRQAFGDALLLVTERRMSNRVAFGWRDQPLTRAQWRALEQRVPAWLDADARGQLAETFRHIAFSARRQFDG